MNQSLEDFIGYDFTCINCGCKQYICYEKDFTDADRHACPDCKTVFWWSPKQQKLYLEETQMEIPESYMRCDGPITSVQI